MDSEHEGAPRKTRFHFKLSHDMALLAQVQALNPATAHRPKLVWDQIARNLSQSKLEMPVTGRTCKGRTQILYNRLEVKENEVLEWMQKPAVLLGRLRESREATNAAISKAACRPRKRRRRSIGSEGGASDRSLSRSFGGGVRHQFSPAQEPNLEFVLGLDGGGVFEDTEKFTTTNGQKDSVPGASTPGGSGQQNSISYRILQAVEKQAAGLVQWTKRQDAVNQEILRELKNLRQVVSSSAKNTVGLPNPCVRLERLETGLIPSGSTNMWRNTRTYPKPKSRPRSKSTRRESSSPQTDPDNNHDPRDNFDLVDEGNDDFLLQSADSNEEDDEETSRPLPPHFPVAVKLEVDSSAQRPDFPFDLDHDVDGFMAMAASLSAPSNSNEEAAAPPEADASIIARPRLARKALAPAIAARKRSGPVQCDQCATVLKSVEILRQHQHSVHEGHRPHICQTCGRSFARKLALENHELTHSSDRPFKCKYCESRFRQPQGLYIHERRHLLGSRYSRSQCAQCGQLFVSDYNMRKHVLVVHGGVRAYACHLCGKPFKTPTHLKYHVGTHERPGRRQRGLNREPVEEEGKLPRIKRVGGVSKIKPVVMENAALDLKPNGVAAPEAVSLLL